MFPDRMRFLPGLPEGEWLRERGGALSKSKAWRKRKQQPNFQLCLESNLLLLARRPGKAWFAEGFVGAGPCLTLANRLRARWLVKPLHGLAGEGVLSSWALPIERSGVEEKWCERFMFDWGSPISSWNFSVRGSLTSSTHINLLLRKTKVTAKPFLLQRLPFNLVTEPRSSWLLGLAT